MSETFPAGAELLILEDDAALRKRLASHLKKAGAEVTEAGTLQEARRLLPDLRFEFAVVDLHLPDGDVLSLLREQVFPETTTVVVMTAFGGIKEAVEAMRFGAGDYLTKPFEPDEVVLALLRSRQARRSLRRDELRATEPGSEALFFGQALQPLRTSLDAILDADRRLQRQLPPILIEGETGTGKTAFAHWIHQHGPRAERPFTSLNCAALPETLAESELFGHERGAFTDAKKARLGLFEAADGGTLFLDEIASLSLATQAKLLTAIEEGKIRRLGGTRELPVDTRVIAASNRPLPELVQQGAFREDLYHRLNLLRLELPPLRQRGADIVPLAQHLLTKAARRHRITHPEITAEGAARLQVQPWRGNVRELDHEIQRALIFSPGNKFNFAHLGDPTATTPASWRNPAWRLPEDAFSLDSVIDEFVAEALREANNNVSAAARRLGVTREFLRYRLSEERPGPTTER